MKTNPIIALVHYGQSIWLDYIRRDMIHNGELARFIDEDGISGMTSNPAIFEKAISGGDFYDAEIRKMALEGKSPEEILEVITIEDVQAAADAFRPVYDRTDGQDGFVSLEVNPHLALNTEGTIKEARRLWEKLGRQNVYIKVPATAQGISAISELISDGINVNVTLLFGIDRYREVAEAYIRGIENRINTGKPVHSVSSVASFFVSRMDTLVDPMIQEFSMKNGEQGHFGINSYGETGIANAIMAYDAFQKIFQSERFLEMMKKGARVQRVLWASTGTKNPNFSDVKYLDALAIRDTINTVPPETLNAYRDHGDIKQRKEPDPEKASTILGGLPEMGIVLKKITDDLEREGIEKFNQPYDKLIATIREKIALYRK